MTLRSRDMSDEEWGAALLAAYDEGADALVERHLETTDGDVAFIGRVSAFGSGTVYRVIYRSGPSGYDSETVACSCGATDRGELCWHVAGFQEAIELQGDENEIPWPDLEVVESIEEALR